ncbi:MAG TPA: N-6 DNA methylase [Gemmatimonadaceae bacterium]|nr:N-6 DNA methylase [Gemmatimonadaceae bacterium]
MRTLRSASVLLANTTSVECCAPLIAELGFSADLVGLDEETRDRFGIDAVFHNAAVSAGPGAMRALIVEIDSSELLRDLLVRLARRLSSRTPHVLWTVVVISKEPGEIAIACWFAAQYAPRVVALVAVQRNIVDSDAETLCAMAAAASESDLATHTRWLEILGRQSVTRNFFRAMASSISDLAASLPPPIPHGAAKELSLLHLSRLLFLTFLETKAWLNGDHAFLANQFADCMLHGGRYHQRVLAPLFFGTLNTRAPNRAARACRFGRIPFLNGGLFTRSPIEKTHSKAFFSDEALGDLFGQLLTRYRFTAREDSSVWSEAAVDPEMLGKAFESFMAAPDRKNSGAFYTPQELVEQLTTSAIASGVQVHGIDDGIIAAALAGEIPPTDDRERLLRALGDLRVLDPACGSGAFLVHCLERVAALRIHLGDISPLHQIRRQILTRSIFGVDVNPTAVWLCELRLWLSTAIQDPERDPLKVKPLPNLDRNIRVGDSLTGGAFNPDTRIPKPARIALVRAQYSRAVGPRKISLARKLDKLERDSAIASLDGKIAALSHERRELLGALRSRDLFGERGTIDSGTRVQLRELRAAIRTAQASILSLSKGAALPFSYETHFADVASEGGFSVIIGNPPWVRLHNIDPQSKATLFREFSAFNESAWKSGAERASASRGFAAQIDLAALFVEQAVRLARVGGVIVLLVPAKLWRSLAGGGIRTYLLGHADIVEIHDLTESQPAFDAAVYPSIVVARRRATLGAAHDPVARAVVHRRQSALHWPVKVRCLAFDETTGAPWLIVPPDVRTSFDAVRHAGRPLSESPFGRPLLGVKTGCNAAFVVRRDFTSAEEESALVEISSGDRRGVVERTMLRPMHRGETLHAWRLPSAPEHIVWTHEERAPMRELPRHAHRWLSHSRSTLEQRSDARGARWWTIFRTESADSSKPRVAWSDFGKNPRAAVLGANDTTVLLNSCYVVRCGDMTDAFALAALLNSALAAAWLNTIAEPARGGFHRYLGWTVALLPIPEDWPAARAMLAPLGKQGMDGNAPSSIALLAATTRVYGLHRSDVEPLLLWNAR